MSILNFRLSMCFAKHVLDIRCVIMLRLYNGLCFFFVVAGNHREMLELMLLERQSSTRNTRETTSVATNRQEARSSRSVCIGVHCQLRYTAISRISGREGVGIYAAAFASTSRSKPDRCDFQMQKSHLWLNCMMK